MCNPDLHLSIKRLVHGDKREWDLFKQIDKWDIKEVVQEVFIRLIKEDYHL